MNTVHSGAVIAESSASSDRIAGPETLSGLAISFAFWLSLLLAAIAFAAVGLSPKLLEHARLSGEYAANHDRLVRIERQNEQLQRVIDAIKNDPEFAAEMTRVEFDAVRTGEEIIPVDSDLKLEPRGIAGSGLVSASAISRVWYRPLVVPFAENETLRRTLLAGAALLIIVSFTWFQPIGTVHVNRSDAAGRSFWETVRARYVRSA